jgi:hypothetical protein
MAYNATLSYGAFARIYDDGETAKSSFWTSVNHGLYRLEMQRIQSKDMSWEDKMAAFVAIPRKSRESLMELAGFDVHEIRNAFCVVPDHDPHRERLEALAAKLGVCIVVWSETPNGFIKDCEKACRVGVPDYIFGSPGEKPGENFINLVMRDNNRFRFVEILHDDEIRMFVDTAAQEMAEMAERLAKQEKERMELADYLYAIMVQQNENAMDIDSGACFADIAVGASWGL